MNLQIREASIEDLESLRELFVEENRFHAQLVPEHVRPTQDVLTRVELEDFVSSPVQRIFVGDDGDDLLGAIIVKLKEQPADRWKAARRFGYVDELIVSANARGRGVGSQLMAAARDWLLSKGVRAMELHVWSANVDARQFYEALGMRTLQRRMIWDLTESPWMQP